MASALASARSSQRRSLSNMSTTSTSLSHAINSIDNSKPAIIIEIGNNLTKCGFAGELVPKIVRTEYRDDQLNIHRNIFRSKGPEPNERDIFHFFKYIFYNVMIAMPRERRVVIVENLFCPTNVRKSICKVLMEQLYVPSVLFLPSHLCTTFPFNTTNALVVDIGCLETSAIPIAEGVTMINNWEISSAGSDALEQNVLKLLKEHGKVETYDRSLRDLTDEDFQFIEENRVVETIICRALFCTTKERAEKLKEDPSAELTPKIKPARVPISAETLIIPGYIREMACEVFFDNSSDDSLSIPLVIHNIVAKLPRDLRKKMFEGLLVVGGCALISGFLARLKEELQIMGKENNLKTSDVIKFYQFKGTSNELYLGWLGGSMFGALQEPVLARSITRDHWLDKKTLPDWTDFVEFNVPNGRFPVNG